MSQVVHRKNLDFFFYWVCALGELLENPRFAAYDRVTIAGILDIGRHLVVAEAGACFADRACRRFRCSTAQFR